MFKATKIILSVMNSSTFFPLDFIYPLYTVSQTKKYSFQKLYKHNLTLFSNSTVLRRLIPATNPVQFSQVHNIYFKMATGLWWEQNIPVYQLGRNKWRTPTYVILSPATAIWEQVTAISLVYTYDWETKVAAFVTRILV